MKHRISAVFFNTSHLPINWFYKDLILGLSEYLNFGVAIPTSEFLDSEVLSSVRFHRFSVERKPSVVGFLKNTPRVLREIRTAVGSYDIIVSNNIVSGFYLALHRLAASKKKTWIHCFTGQIWSSNKRPLLNPYFWIDMVIFKLADKIVFDSPSQLKFFEKNCLFCAGKKNIWVGFSVFGVRRSLLAKAQELKVANSPKKQHLKNYDRLDRSVGARFGYVGRISRDKGIYDLFRAFEQLHQSGLNIRFDCWGVAEDKKLEDILRTSKFCCFHGETSDVSESFREIDFLLVPSFREGFGNVVLEASLFGVRAICRDIFGLQDVSAFCESIVLPDDYRESLVTGIIEGRLLMSPGEKVVYAQSMLGKYRTYLSEDRLTAFYHKLFEAHISDETSRHYFLEEGVLE